MNSVTSSPFALWVVVIGVVVLSGLLAAVAVAPWLVVVQLVLWERSHRLPEAPNKR